MSSRIRFTTARQVFEAFASANRDIVAPPSDDAPLEFLRGLAGSPTPEDAISFCAYLLPRREAVWWVCQCLRAMGAAGNPADERAIAAAEAWVREPEEPARQVALTIGEAADPASPATWAALAAAWSGGSLSAPDLPVVPPPAQLTAQAARAALLTGIARVGVDRRAYWLKACVDACIRFAGGGEARP